MKIIVSIPFPGSPLPHLNRDNIDLSPHPPNPPSFILHPSLAPVSKISQRELWALRSLLCSSSWGSRSGASSYCYPEDEWLKMWPCSRLVLLLWGGQSHGQIHHKHRTPIFCGSSQRSSLVFPYLRARAGQELWTNSCLTLVSKQRFPFTSKPSPF